MAIGGYAQNVKAKNFHYRYQMTCLDSTFDSKTDSGLEKYMARQKARLNKKMNEGIGQCPETMVMKVPQSRLSNYLTDLLLQKASAYAKKGQVDHCDLSILNCGGIRASMQAGNVTVGNIFAISPFDNYLVFVDLKGSELRKCFERFHQTKGKAVYSGAQITFQNQKPIDVLVQGKPIQDDRIYKVVTLNFISDGGDNIMSGLQYEKVVFIPVIFRNFIIREIKNMSGPITANEDDRVIIK